MIVDQKLNKKFVGLYLIDNGSIDGTQLATTTKPNWFRILMTNFFLGWKWIRIEDLKILQENQKNKKELETLKNKKIENVLIKS